MTPAVVAALIAGQETLGVEFEGDARLALSDNDLIEIIVCLANRPGTTAAPSVWVLVPRALPPCHDDERGRPTEVCTHHPTPSQPSLALP